MISCKRPETVPYPTNCRPTKERIPFSKKNLRVLYRHVQSQEGEWIDPRNKNCRFLDIWDEFPNVNDRDVPLSFLVVLLIIKCRIVATYDATCISIDLAFRGGQRIQAV